jgi:hypothetical protein
VVIDEVDDLAVIGRQLRDAGAQQGGIAVFSSAPSGVAAVSATVSTMV